ncbi:MAG: carboxymuconolactone decarboxylase family protein [Thomasclavelia sp.]|nr:carboxymuconolactone decarboxylase family protein [Thomasclavelia sp.]
MLKKKETAGRDYLGAFAPKFAQLNDDVLFGEVWSREELSSRDRSLITISALMGSGILDQSMEGHLKKAKENGITKKEIVEVITQLAFYTGWPKAWSMFAMAMEIYKDDSKETLQPLLGLGEKIDDPKHFSGTVYVKKIWGFDKPLLIDNVTFEPGCVNNWHVHQVGQTLFVTDGVGYYQEEGKERQVITKGDIIEIPAGVKHFHGATKDSFMSHIALEDYSKGAPTWYGKVEL